MKFAVVRTGGKQYIVHENDELVIDHLGLDDETAIELETLAVGDDETQAIELGTPTLKSLVKAKVLESAKGDKVRSAKFKAKVRYRKVKGFRPVHTKIKIVSI